jgi:hypothetical protein
MDVIGANVDAAHTIDAFLNIKMRNSILLTSDEVFFFLVILWIPLLYQRKKPIM